MVTQGKTTTTLPPPALKICGVRTETDSSHCLAAGVDFVGFNFYPGSRRYIEPTAAAAVWKSSYSKVTGAKGVPVAVFVDATEAEVAAAMAAFPALAAVQFHGDETPQDLAQLRRHLGSRAVWKAIGVQDADDVGRAAAFAVVASLVLFDAPPQPGNVGGTGQRFSWHLAADCSADVELGIAGGIKPGMLAELQKALHPKIPSLIDVCSGVELSPGQKDPAKVTALVTELRRLTWALAPLLCLALLWVLSGASSALAQTDDPLPQPEFTSPPAPTPTPAPTPAPAPKSVETEEDGGVLPKFDVSVSEFITHQDMHRWERHVRGFRREHNFALTAGVTAGSWSIQWSGEESPRSYENTGIYSRFQYSFHLQLYKGFGYILGSGTGYLYESVDRRRTFRPVSAFQYPGLLTGLTLNVNPVLRLSTTFEAYLERHNGIEGRTTSGEDRKIHVTLQAYDVGVYTDIFYDLSWAIRIEGHFRHVEYLKPTIKSGNYPVDARLHKDDRWLGMGLVYHLL